MAFLIPFPEVSSISGFCRNSPANFASNLKPRNVQNYAVSENSTKDRVRIISRMKDLESRVSNSGHNLRLYGQFSASVMPNTTPSSKRSKEDDEKQNYYVNAGDAIRTLREEFPELFHRELSFHIYREDIVFKDPLNTFVGIENYKSIFWALRFHGRIFFKALWFDIGTVWQPVENTIMVRWTVHGMPRVPWEKHGRFDGTSEYKLDKNGKIYEHRVHNIALNAPPKFRVQAVEELLQSFGCPSTPKPTYFEFSSSSISEILPSSVKFTGARHYLASIFTIARRPEAEPSQRR